MESIKVQAESLCIEAVADGFRKMEEQDVRVAIILMSPIMFTNFKELTGGGTNASADSESNGTGFFWGAEIKVDPMLPENKIILNPAERFGSKSVELIIEQPMKRDLLWSIVKSE